MEMLQRAFHSLTSCCLNCREDNSRPVSTKLIIRLTLKRFVIEINWFVFVFVGGK